MKEVEVQHTVNLTMIYENYYFHSNQFLPMLFSVWCISNRNEQSIFSSSKKFLEGNIRQIVSTLHAWIRFLECMLHISYKMPIMKWQARTEDENNSVKLRKVEVRAEFQKRMGLVIDQPRVGGAGISNNGNTARRFFQQYDVSANIMNLDAGLMRVVMTSTHQNLKHSVGKLLYSMWARTLYIL